MLFLQQMTLKVENFIRQKIMKSNKEYKVKVQFILEGEVTVNACSKNEAKELVEESFGLVVGGNLHSVDSRITDWDFPVHPEMIVK